MMMMQKKKAIKRDNIDKLKELRNLENLMNQSLQFRSLQFLLNFKLRDMNFLNLVSFN
ncbi:hypothetical protein [Borrelia duttonii]|uniref:hypothetical protein n=1 Tax=Borrelia duttonii TaxID=40834 RepID=UPI0013050D93